MPGEPDERLGRDLLGGHLVQRGEGVTLGDGDHQRFGGDPTTGEVVEVAERHPEEGGVDVAGTELDPAFLVVLCRQGELHERMLGSEAVDHCGRHATVRSVRVGEAKATFPAVPGLTNQGDGVVRLVEEATGQVDEEAARFGQLHAAAGAIQELDAELLLESPDLLAERGLGDVLSLGRPSEVQLLGDGEEVAQLALLQSGPPFRAWRPPTVGRPFEHAGERTASNAEE